jgi:hypothetical protein
MVKSPALRLLLLLSLCFAAASQTRGSPSVSEPADKPSGPQGGPIAVHTSHINAAQLRLDAKELLDLCQSLQVDIEQVNRGMLPKDTVLKLKRIEKLSKQLRSEVAPY